MTRERVRTQQAVGSDVTVRMIRVTIAGTNPLRITLPGGSTVTAVAVTGLTYTVGGTAWAFFQEPAVIAVLPTA